MVRHGEVCALIVRLILLADTDWRQPPRISEALKTTSRVAKFGRNVVQTAVQLLCDTQECGSMEMQILDSAAFNGC